MSVLANSLKAESLELCVLHVKGVRLIVLRALSLKYKTRSELHKETGLRISTLCSALKKLEDDGWVRVAFDTDDLETNRKVSCYTTTQACDAHIDLIGGVVERHWLGAA